MRRLVWGIIILSLGLAPTASAALGAVTRVRVSPRTGGVHTNFVLRFSIPLATGHVGGIDVTDWVWVTGRSRRGCIGDVGIPLRAAPAGTAFKITMDPAHLDGHWCTGRFTGVLMERRTTACPPMPGRILCPLYVVAPQVLARFRFTVRPLKKTATTHSPIG